MAARREAGGHAGRKGPRGAERKRGREPVRRGACRCDCGRKGRSASTQTPTNEGFQSALCRGHSRADWRDRRAILLEYCPPAASGRATVPMTERYDVPKICGGCGDDTTANLAATEHTHAT